MSAPQDRIVAKVSRGSPARFGTVA